MTKNDMHSDPGSADHLRAVLKLAIKGKLTVSINPECVIRSPVTPEVFQEAFALFTSTPISISVDELDSTLALCCGTKVGQVLEIEYYS